MRHAAFFFLLGLMTSGCAKQSSPDCYPHWKIDRHEISCSAAIDSGQLVLTAWNASISNAIEMNREPLESSFELSINLVDLEWDSLTAPQFRFEVFDLNAPEMLLSGLAVNKTVVYAYVGTEADQSDIRLISSHQGTLTITRSEGRMTCRAELGEVVISYSDTLTANDMGVRLILGATAPSTGKIQAVLDDFVVSGGWTHSQISAPKVWSDYFDCENW